MAKKTIEQIERDPLLFSALKQVDTKIDAYRKVKAANKARELLRKAVEKGDQNSYDKAVGMMQQPAVAKLLRRVFPEVLVMTLTHESGPVSRIPFSSLAKWAAGIYKSRGKDIWEDHIGLP